MSSSDEDMCSEEYFSDTEEMSDIENNTHTDILYESIKNLQPYQWYFGFQERLNDSRKDW